MAYNLEHTHTEDREDFYSDPRDDGEIRRPGRLRRFALAVVVMGVFAGGLWLAYTQGMRYAGSAADGVDVPLVRADTRPYKIKPENPGGMPIPDREMLVYGQEHPQVEHLLPPPEQPMLRPAPPPYPPPQAGEGRGGGAPVPAVQSAPSAAPAKSSPPQPEADPIAERITQIASQPIKPLSPQTGSGKAGGLRLQLGAVRSESEARGEWERLKRKNADLLGHLTAVAVRADLGDKGVYFRIQAGPVGDASTADRLCGELRQRHLACMIVR